MRQEKRNGSKVSACYSCNVVITNDKLELLDVVCNLKEAPAQVFPVDVSLSFSEQIFNKTAPDA